MDIWFYQIFQRRLVLVLKLGIGLALMLSLVPFNSTYFFLGVSKVKPVEWLVFNAGAP